MSSEDNHGRQKLTCVCEAKFFDAADMWVSTGRFTLYLVATENHENIVQAIYPDFPLTRKYSFYFEVLKSIQKGTRDTDYN